MIDSLKKQILESIHTSEIDSNSIYTIFYFLYLYKSKDFSVDDLMSSINPKQFLLEKNRNNSILLNEKIIEIFHSKIGVLNNHFISSVFQVLKKYDKDLFCQKYAEIFDDLLYYIPLVINKKTGIYLLPDETINFMVSLIEIPEYAKVYNPFAGFASFGVKLSRTQNYSGEEINELNWAVGALRLSAYNIDSSSYTLKTSVAELYNEKTKYDVIISSPPFGEKFNPRAAVPGLIGLVANIKEVFHSTKLETLTVKKSIEKLNENGQLCLLLPASFLSNGGEALKLRQKLVGDNLLDRVIALPSGSLFNSELKTVVVIIKKNRKKSTKIDFVNGEDFVVPKFDRKLKAFDFKGLQKAINIKDEKIYKTVDLNFIKQNDFNLAVSRYVFEDIEFDSKQKKFLQPFNKLLFPAIWTKPSGTEARVVKIKDLAYDIINYEVELNSLAVEEVKNGWKEITADEFTLELILIARIGSKLKPSLLRLEPGERLVISENIFAFVCLENNVDLTFLLLQLSENYFQQQLERIRYGSAQKVFNLKELKQLKIYKPSYLEQRKIAEELLRNLREKKQKIDAVFLEDKQADLLDENSFLRHQISGTLNNLRASFKNATEILNQQITNQIPDLLEYKQNDLVKSNLGEYLNRIERDIHSISKALQNTGNTIALNAIDKTEIDLIAFVKNYISELESRTYDMFSIAYEIDEEVMKEITSFKLMIQGDKDLLRKMFDNIIENVEKHAFLRKKSIINKIKFEFVLGGLEESEIQLDICNTGKELPENFSHEAFTRKGSTSGEYAGDGTGGAFINEVMKIHNGNFGFTDETGPEGLGGEYVTSMELTFPLTFQ